MNSAIKKKLAAIVTASILMVAVVVTACVLYVPGLYNGGDVPTSNTEDGGVFGMNKVTYDSSNSGLVYVKRMRILQCSSRQRYLSISLRLCSKRDIIIRCELILMAEEDMEIAQFFSLIRYSDIIPPRMHPTTTR